MTNERKAGDREALRAVLLFHARVGVRLSLRAMAPLAGLFVAVIGLADEPAAWLAGIAGAIAAPGAGPEASAALLAIALVTTGWSAPRLTLGIHGWIRHLPADGATHRRAALAALALTQAPVLLLALVLALARAFHGDPVSIGRLAGLPILALAAATVTLPVRRSTATATLGISAGILTVAGGLPGLVAAAAILVAADRVSGPLRAGRTELRRLAAPAAGALRPVPSIPFDARIAWRALGGRIVSAFVAPAIVLGFCALFLRNNTLSASVAGGGARFGGLLAAAVLMAGIAADLGSSRPVWPWARSLPWSSSRRALLDALFLAGHAIPVVLAVALLDASAALPVLIAVPLVASRASGALRYAHAMRVGVYGVVLAEGFAVAGAIALLPWASLLALAAVPLALRAAARRDRDQNVSRWIALHHQAAGDPLSWSGS